MTTSAVTPRVKYNGSASTGPFSIPFYYASSSELLVTKTTSAGVESTLIVTTNYTLSGDGTAGTGALTLLVALAVGETLTIERTTSQTQSVDLEVSYINPEHIEGALDKVTRGIQDLWYQVGRTLRLYKDDTTGSGVYNAGGQKIGNVAEGVADDDVAIMSQLNEIAGSADAAAASAVAAAASAAAAALSAQEIEDVVAGSVTSFEGRIGAITATAGDYTASEITNVPSGNLAATDVQAALNELQSEIDGKQTIDAELSALAGLTSAADRLPYFTGSGTASLATFTSYMRTLLDDADAATARTTLGLAIGTHVQAYNANLADYASDATAFIQTLIDDADAATARTTLELGSAALADEADFQDADATLDALAAYNADGFVVQTAADTFVAREITASSGIAVTNGDGVAGDPALVLDINALAARTAFESGDKLVIYEDGVGIRKIDYDDLPQGGGSGSGGGVSDAYKNITDGTNTAVAAGIDTFKVRAGTGMSVTVTNDDGTHGDNILYELDATLSALSAVTFAADKMLYATGADAFATTDLTSFARGLLDDADAAAMQTTLGLVPGVNVQAYDVELAALAGLTSAADKVPYFTGSGTAATTDFTSVARTLVNQTTQALMRTTGLGLSSNGSSLVSAADYAAMRALLDLEAGTDFLSPAAIAAAYQPLDGELSALAGLTSAADKVPYYTGSGTAALADLPSYGRTLIANSTAALARTDLELDGYSAKNALINGCFRINQRQAASNADDTYAHDRWNILTQTGTVAASTQTLVENGTPAMMRITQSQASAQRFGVEQIIEAANTYPLRGQAVTLSARVRMSASTTLRYAVLEWTGTADSVTSDVVNSWTSGTFTAGNFFLGSNLTVTATGSTALTANTLTSISLNATIGSSANNIIVLFWTDSTQAQNVTFDIGKAQLEIGSAATGFERIGAQTVLAQCQRYFEKSYPVAVAPGTSTYDGVIMTESLNYAFQILSNITFKQEKRVAATVTIYGRTGTSGSAYDGTTNRAVVCDPATTGCYLYLDNAASAAGNDLQYHFTADAEL